MVWPIPFLISMFTALKDLSFFLFVCLFFFTSITQKLICAGVGVMWSNVMEETGRTGNADMLDPNIFSDEVPQIK